jgi:lipopolysaccharide/colanic/teichoic acid biosynthesis glycosyltransferase
MRSCYDMIEMVVQIADTAGIHVSGMRDSVGSQRRKERGRVRGMFQNVTVERRTQRLGQAAKRTLDVVGAATLIVLTAPLMLVIGLLVKATSPGPIFFVQSRVGLRRRTFPMFKFRSMIVGAHEQLAALEARNEAAGPLFKLSEDPRTTAFGRFLRRNSLDELPQLFNVLLGHMSLVGPRPMSLRDASHISHVSMIKRFTVKPGMTGMWQVQGRSSASLDQWIAMDARYVDQWTVGLDLQQLVMTVPAVLRRSGAM